MEDVSNLRYDSRNSKARSLHTFIRHYSAAKIPGPDRQEEIETKVCKCCLGSWFLCTSCLPKIRVVCDPSNREIAVHHNITHFGILLCISFLLIIAVSFGVLLLSFIFYTWYYPKKPASYIKQLLKLLSMFTYGFSSRFS